LDDTEEEDVLVHLIPAISFIQEQLDMDRGVLVHCQAGMSPFSPVRLHLFLHIAHRFTGRSVTIVAAYLMYSQNLDETAALDLIRNVRPEVQSVELCCSIRTFSHIAMRSPNDGFLSQLHIFHQASFKVSRRDKATRMFYLERAVNEIMRKCESIGR
jgi:dual specificity phosphatase 12